MDKNKKNSQKMGDDNLFDIIKILISVGVLVFFSCFLIAGTRWMLIWYPDIPLIFRILYCFGVVGVIYKIMNIRWI